MALERYKTPHPCEPAVGVLACNVRILIVHRCCPDAVRSWQAGRHTSLFVSFCVGLREQLFR